MTFGALTVVRPDGSAFTGDEVRFLAELGHRRRADARQRAAVRERAVTSPSSSSGRCCPPGCPRIAELDVAGRYLAGAAGTEVGGDWYDVIPLPAGASPSPSAT